MLFTPAIGLGHLFIVLRGWGFRQITLAIEWEEVQARSYLEATLKGGDLDKLK